MAEKTNLEIMKAGTLDGLGAGSIFTYGGIRWLVLERTKASTLVLAVDLLPDEMPFDEQGRNDWAVSSLREYLNGEFMKQLVEAGADADAFLEMVVDLTSDNALYDYGKDRCKIALISDAQYRRFRKIIPNAENWWWTITPFSTEKNGFSRNVRNVSTSGALNNNNASNGTLGVRPLCNLKSSILVSFNPDEIKAPAQDAADEKTDAEKRADALDMMRHIAAAWDVKPEELARIFSEQEPEPTAAEPEGVEPPDVAKAFLRDVVGLPEEMVNAARAKKMPDGGFAIEVEAPEAEATEAETTTKAELREGLEDLIGSTHAMFKNLRGGFDANCFNALVNAYGMAIHLAPEGGE